MTFTKSFLTVATFLVALAAIIAFAPEAQASHNYRICREVRVIPSVELCRAIRVAAPRVGVPTSWAHNPHMAELVRRESGFDRCAVNPRRHGWCWYTGSNACGWYQLNPCRCFPKAVTQAVCGTRYILERFGSPRAALTYHNNNGSY
jgi:hypothetical protein